ncbi:NUDIX domain-containing protein [Streptomyces avidinii]|uniref:NUDIX domain-containing protein n=1 Tax=Streptomyces avidinii TaxID=1895 RepID=UPI0038638D5E|nr:NUDIX domain-containing protein [Streptomyces avidinii]
MPAGSIRPGEAPESAALREAREETGLSDFKIVRKLGETEYDISPYRFEIQHRHVFHLELTEPTPERWMSQEDHDGKQAPTYFECSGSRWRPRTFSSPAKARCWGVCRPATVGGGAEVLTGSGSSHLGAHGPEPAGAG